MPNCSGSSRLAAASVLADLMVGNFFLSLLLRDRVIILSSSHYEDVCCISQKISPTPNSRLGLLNCDFQPYVEFSSLLFGIVIINGLYRKSLQLDYSTKINAQLHT